MSTATQPPRMPALLLTIFLLNGIEFLQAGMMAFGAVPIMGQIHASPEEYSIVTAAYASVAIAMIAKQRWLLERLGWRTFLHGSIVFFLSGAAICALSDSFPQFLLGRTVMGLGGAAFMTSARMLINLIPPSPRRRQGIAAFATALGAGNAAAPWIVSTLFDAGHWQAIFALLAALALAAAWLARALPDQAQEVTQHSTSHVGTMSMLAGGSFLLLFALQRALYDFYSGLPLLLLLGGGGAAALLYFVWQQQRHQRPLLQLRQLAHRRYLLGLLVFTLCYVILGANNTMLPVLMQRALGYSWHSAGMVQSIGLSSALVGFAVMIRIMKVAPAPQKFFGAGFLALAISAWLLSRLTVEANLWRDVLPAIALFGIFIVLVLAQTAIHAFTDLQHNEAAFSHGQQVKNMLSQFGIALGIAGATLLQQWRSVEHYAVLNARFVNGDAELVRLLEQLGNWFSAASGPQVASQLAVAQLSQLMNQQATLLAGLEYFAALAVLAVVSGVLLVCQRTLALKSA